MPATIDRPRSERQASAAGPPPTREVSIAVAHQKGGVGKSTSTALLAAEIAWLRTELRRHGAK
jgi:Mrp family chromosome partitioning ATPase